MSREYEIVYIFDSALEEPQINEHLDRFHELLKNAENLDPISGVNHWGKRTLAYPIKNREQGYYVVVRFETDTTLLPEFERVLKLEENVLRHLVVLNERVPITPVVQSESAGQPADNKDRPSTDKPSMDKPSEEGGSDATPQ